MPLNFIIENSQQTRIELVEGKFLLKKSSNESGIPLSAKHKLLYHVNYNQEERKMMKDPAPSVEFMIDIPTNKMTREKCPICNQLSITKSYVDNQFRRYKKCMLCKKTIIMASKQPKQPKQSEQSKQPKQSEQSEQSKKQSVIQ